MTWTQLQALSLAVMIIVYCLHLWVTWVRLRRLEQRLGIVERYVLVRWSRGGGDNG